MRIYSLTNKTRNRTTGYNSTYPKGGVSCSKDSFVVIESIAFRHRSRLIIRKIEDIRIENSNHCKPTNRYR